MEKNIILLVVITAVAFFVVGNPITYGIMSKVTGLKVKNKKDHMILVAIHSIVMTLLMYAAYVFLIKDKECPPCPAKKPCAVCEKKKEQKPPAPPAQPPAPPADGSLVEGYTRHHLPPDLVEGYGSCSSDTVSGYGNYPR
jgi:hypothetical protein